MKPAAQVNLWDELIVDNFAGGGGASTGIELATGRVVDIAINHDSDAIRMHEANHPHTEHYQANVWDIDPVQVCRGRSVGLAWFSPDCKHFSKAKGGKPVEKKIRGLAWIVLRWAGTVRPRVIIVENVEEFQTWGPVRRGKPVRKLAGQTFRRWLAQLRNLGYDTDYRELVAADYGAPTTRKRFFMVARCDGQPIVWPEPTHAPADSPEVLAGRKKPWRGAAEIIDWNLPCPSIFETRAEIKARYGLSAQRPLKPNTLRRVARGLDKFVIRNRQPFIVPTGWGERDGQKPRVNDINLPLTTIVSKEKHNLCSASLIQYHTEQGEAVRGQGLDLPLQTVDASNRYGIAAASLCKYYGGDFHGQDVEEPLHTVTAKDREGVTEAFLQLFHAGGYHGKGNSPESPINTVLSSGGISLQVVHMEELYGSGQGRSASYPVSTITASGAHHGVVVTTVCAADSSNLRRWPQIRELLNRYCGYQLGEDDVLLFQIGTGLYFMADVGLRMLTPRELYRAQGFPDDYIIDRDAEGRAYSRSAQVARCGNAVCPPMAAAIVRANYESAPVRIDTMEQFQSLVSA
ncbi:MAG: DNA cytosine methyltransferase [Oscillibacter sp.]|nr:DNA cytosine methyltransferase [Oscillibacter sp.]